MNLNVWDDFQICISVPLNVADINFRVIGILFYRIVRF